MTTLILHVDDGKDTTMTFEVPPELMTAMYDPDVQAGFQFARDANPLVKYFSDAINERMEDV